MSQVKCRYLFTIDYTKMNINISVPHIANQHLATSSGWLSFNPTFPKLYVTAEGEDFDAETLKAWREEGFEVSYLPMGNNKNEYRRTLQSLGDGLSVGDRYAIVAYGEAATECLEANIAIHTWNTRCCALVAYYPTAIPAPNTRYSSSIRVLVHLAGGTVGVSSQKEILGIQGKRKTVTKRVTPGTFVAGLQTKMGYKCYTYQGVDVGFAERDLEEWDGVAEAVAWSRSLKTVREAFNGYVDLETGWELASEAKYHGTGDFERDASNIVDQFGDRRDSREPYTVNGPTMTGAIGKRHMRKFYSDIFLPADMEEKQQVNLRMRLISRTIGVDRIVDELLVRFKHAAPMDWILPGIPATNKEVEIMVICIVALRAGKLWCEHLYWDQGSVLVQTGLLDPKLIPDSLKNKGVERLPVLGKESAEGVVSMLNRQRGDKEVEELNEMIKDW